ncbi:hypothetical protein [Variovorax sp. OV329]|uniref:hypothetical protein n=1 Tax=Variovorax sp. OV329 TaxID=1882825 RepID=UPI001114131C|nr:hypothetical protein [Variovorax sp. OV329]
MATNNAVRRAGYYVARDELGANITGISAPVLGEQGDPLGALVMTFASDSPPWMGEETIAKITMQHAQQADRRAVGIVSGPPRRHVPLGVLGHRRIRCARSCARVHISVLSRKHGVNGALIHAPFATVSAEVLNAHARRQTVCA